MPKKPSLPGDASVFIAVNVPAKTDKEYNAHAGRAVRLMTQAGYEAHAMTAAFILKMADDIREAMADAEKMERHLAAVAQTRQTERTDDGSPEGD